MDSALGRSYPILIYFLDPGVLLYHVTSCSIEASSRGLSTQAVTSSPMPVQQAVKIAAVFPRPLLSHARQGETELRGSALPLKRYVKRCGTGVGATRGRGEDGTPPRGTRPLHNPAGPTCSHCIYSETSSLSTLNSLCCLRPRINKMSLLTCLGLLAFSLTALGQPGPLTPATGKVGGTCEIQWTADPTGTWTQVSRCECRLTGARIGSLTMPPNRPISSS